MKAALVLSKIKNEDIKTSERVIDEMKNNLLELKRQLLNEVRKGEEFCRSEMWWTSFLFRSQRKEKNKLLEKLRLFQKSALEAQQSIDEYKVCGAGFKMKCWAEGKM